MNPAFFLFWWFNSDGSPLIEPTVTPPERIMVVLAVTRRALVPVTNRVATVVAVNRLSTVEP